MLALPSSKGFQQSQALISREHTLAYSLQQRLSMPQDPLHLTASVQDDLRTSGASLEIVLAFSNLRFQEPGEILKHDVFVGALDWWL